LYRLTFRDILDVAKLCWVDRNGSVLSSFKVGQQQVNGVEAMSGLARIRRSVANVSSESMQAVEAFSLHKSHVSLVICATDSPNNSQQKLPLVLLPLLFSLQASSSSLRFKTTQLNGRFWMSFCDVIFRDSTMTPPCHCFRKRTRGTRAKNNRRERQRRLQAVPLHSHSLPSSMLDG